VADCYVGVGWDPGWMDVVAIVIAAVIFGLLGALIAGFDRI
jgi:ABC-type branched-subunit amino acid transport system permease subunit